MNMLSVALPSFHGMARVRNGVWEDGWFLCFLALLSLQLMRCIMRKPVFVLNDKRDAKRNIDRKRLPQSSWWCHVKEVCLHHDILT